jgi:hypothetical protein
VVVMMAQDLVALDAKSSDLAEKLEVSLKGELKHKVREQVSHRPTTTDPPRKIR